MFSKSFLARWPFDINAGVNMQAIFWLGIMVLMQIPRSRFKQSKQKMNCFFFKGLVKSMEIGNLEDLMLLQN